jgi:TonB family protein
MISRILVPRDASLPAEGSVEPGKRRKTALDTRTVVASDLPFIPLDPHTNIPAYMPMDVLPARQLIARDMPVHRLDTVRTIPSHVPLAVLGDHVAVPKDAILTKVEPKRQTAQFTAEMSDVLEPDVITTGEVNLLSNVPKGLRDEQRWVLRGTSAILHVTAVIVLLMIPGLFAEHNTPADNKFAQQFLGNLYVPPDMKELRRTLPGPKTPLHVDPKVIRQVAPPTQTAPAPGPISPPSVTHETPKEATPPPVVEQPLPKAPEPQRPVAPQLEEVKPDKPVTGLILPKFSAAGSQLNQSLSDVARTGSGGGTSISGTGRMPGARGPGGGYGAGGAGGGQAGAGLTRLSSDHGLDLSNYDMRVYESVKRNWFSIMPESAIMGDQGVVMLEFCIQRDGTVISAEPVMLRPSGKNPLDNAAMGSIRASSPFEPIPAAFPEPCIRYRFMYCYNVSCGK